MTDFADVYEHGIEAVGDPPQGLLRLATRENRLVYSGYTLAVLDCDGSSLNDRTAHLFEMPAHTVSDYYEEKEVKYCLRGALYHLNRIIDLYVDKCRLLEEIHPVGPAKANTSEVRIMFEVDAFLVAARRVYEAISKVLWKHYVGQPTGRWRSIKSALGTTGIIPVEFDQPLQQSWTTHGEKLGAYRDFIVHTATLADTGATCWMAKYDGRWGATVLLHPNPETKRRAAWDTASDVDALSYCHEVAAHLVGLSEALMTLAAVGTYIANPPRHTR